jgi:predicted phosphodiesterase
MLQRQMQQLGVERRQDDTHEEERSASSSKKILIIGDVHGCLSELKLLIEKATHECNNSQNFFAIILVGDLVNKGPFSAEVIQYVRSQQQQNQENNHYNVFAVRGNHDDAALAAALGDEERAQKPRYNWTKQLSDEDVEWMADLPYTITIPSSYLQSDDNRDTNDANKMAEKDVIVVHAGLLPNVALSDQRPKLMTTIRNTSHLDTSGESDGYEDIIENVAIAKAWKGPEFVIFGHDARRGLQQEEYALGLDTGCVYGKQLTGIILPERQLVSVDALEEYSPITVKK